MRTSMTDRQGPSTSPLVLNLGSDPAPAPGVEVCAYGVGGWKYLGYVIACTSHTMTVCITVAKNPTADKIRQLMKGR